MLKTAIAAAVLLAIAAPASAADFNDAKALCASGIAAKLGKTLEGANVKLVKGRQGAGTQVTVTVSFPDGVASTAQCKVKQGEVASLEVVS
ncbi:MAG: hypothetical protein HXY21_05615 [Parvularculaceae bacterium]|nr:hypothetical protein [Parvularculaceae bacterium]